MAKDRFEVLQKDPSPFFLKGGPTGVLLLHGFGGTPREMEPLGTYLHEGGLTVCAPLLPGHGETLAEMNRHGWKDWLAGTEEAYEQLAEATAEQFVAGFSMGTLLAMGLAARHPEIAGMILYAPAFKIQDWRIRLTPLARYFVKSYEQSGPSDLRDPDAERWLGGFERYPVPAAAELWHLRNHVLRQLRRLRAPVLVAYGTGDASIHPDSGPAAVRRLSRYVPVQEHVLTASGHAIIVDREWRDVAQTTLDFVRKHSRAAPA